jgi:alpha-ketoglutarate-dependent taurine dioxygenase
MKLVPSGQALGATVEGLDLAAPLAAGELEQVMQALGNFGVLRFPGQKLTARQLRDFSSQLGELEINVASGAYQEPGIPEVMILSNIVENGKAIGLADAGQDWHTDMSYSRGIAFANVLYAIEIPRATAGRSATLISATCTPHTRVCRQRSGASSTARPCCTISTSSGKRCAAAKAARARR